MNTTAMMAALLGLVVAPSYLARAWSLPDGVAVATCALITVLMIVWCVGLVLLVRKVTKR